jgi:mRNA interferase HigB
LFPKREYGAKILMQTVARRTLRQFWEKHPQAETPIRVWYATVAKAEWKSPADIKRHFGAAVDFLNDNRVIFDLSGNRYRLVVHVSYTYKRVLVKFIGTHAEYDRINVENV